MSTGSCGDQIACDAISEMQSNDSIIDASNKCLLAVGDASTDDLIDDHGPRGFINALSCAIIQLQKHIESFIESLLSRARGVAPFGNGNE